MYATVCHTILRIPVCILIWRHTGPVNFFCFFWLHLPSSVTEKVLHETGARLFSDAPDDLNARVERVRAIPVEHSYPAAVGPKERITSTVHHLANSGLEYGTGAHGAWLERHIQGAIKQSPPSVQACSMSNAKEFCV